MKFAIHFHTPFQESKLVRNVGNFYSLSSFYSLSLHDSLMTYFILLFFTIFSSSPNFKSVKLIFQSSNQFNLMDFNTSQLSLRVIFINFSLLSSKYFNKNLSFEPSSLLCVFKNLQNKIM